MAATLTRERFAGPDWVFERKLDGVRMLAYKRAHDVRLYSRNQLPLVDPSIGAALSALPVSELILDGEALGSWGKAREVVGYFVFDVLWLDGRDLTGLSLDARREILCSLPFAAPLGVVERLSDPEPWQRAEREGWEGVVAKRRDSVYESRRSPYWLKMKGEASQELVIGGFSEPQGTRVGLGALLVGYYQGTELVFAGKVGTGFDAALLRDLRARLDLLEIAEPPFSAASARSAPRSGVHWVLPELVAQVAFMEWTGHGKLRHPRFVGLRHDKVAREVVREQTP